MPFNDIHTCMSSVIDCLNVSHSDVYLMGTVMLIFGMGLYDLFVNSLDVPGRKRSPNSSRTTVFGSNLFGLFRLRVKIKSHHKIFIFLFYIFHLLHNPQQLCSHFSLKTHNETFNLLCLSFSQNYMQVITIHDKACVLSLGYILLACY